MAAEQTNGQWLKQMILRGIVALITLAAFIYLGDWAIWKYRNATSKDGRGGMGSVTISRFVIAPLKGNREEYYFDGHGPADCSESLFPQGGLETCRSLRRHPVQYDR